MAMAESDPEPQPAASDRVLIALIVDDGKEPPADLPEARALATWVAASALWHPALLTTTGGLPRVEDVGSPTAPMGGEVRLVAAGAAGRLPSGYLSQAEDSGAIVFEGQGDRDRLIAALRERLGVAAGDTSPEAAAVAGDFLALGSAWWWLRDLTLAMGHVDCLDHESLKREALGGAAEWARGDFNAARSRLRASFELLTQARERFFPIDSYLIDLILLDPASTAGCLDTAFEARAPFTLIATARAIESLAAKDPGTLDRLGGAVNEGWGDVAGGSYDETEESLLPVESVFWQYRRASEVYRAHLDNRDVETFARRRFALYPHLPALARRYGMRYALAMGFDAGVFPVQRESKKLWEAIDGTALESVTRPPLGADRPSAGLQLPWRLGKAMKEDGTAVVALAHWPELVAPWFLDFRRVAAYSPVLTRWVTLGDFFHLTDRPYDAFRPRPDDYQTPYLAQLVARGETRPISGRVRHAELRGRLDGLSWLRAIATALAGSATAEGDELETLERGLETGGLDEAAARIGECEPAYARAAAAAIVGTATDGRPGYLILNPLSTPRRIPILLPADAAADLRPEGPLRGSQYTEEGVWAVVDLPSLGFAWIPRQTDPNLPAPAFGAVSASGRVLRNELIEAEIDARTGGLRSIRGLGEASARLGQQLAISGLTSADAQPVAARMNAEAFEVEYAGPCLVQAVSHGVLLDAADKVVARFQQRYRLWTGRPVLEIDIKLAELAPELTVSLAGQDPWARHIACRWAWADANATLRRTSLLGLHPTESPRPETPGLIDITTRKQRTALLFGGLAHHQKQGPRMLDTLLVAGRESAREFRLGVAIDGEFPVAAAADLFGPAYVVPTDAGPPRSGLAGWLFHIDSKAVLVTRLEYVPKTGDERGWGVVVHLSETDGRSVRCRLRCFKDPSWARQIDAHGEPIVDLSTDGDAVRLDLTPYEMARVEITLG